MIVHSQGTYNSTLYSLSSGDSRVSRDKTNCKPQKLKFTHAGLPSYIYYNCLALFICIPHRELVFLQIRKIKYSTHMCKLCHSSNLKQTEK